jgi:protein O-GlcNAc transferase
VNSKLLLDQAVFCHRIGNLPEAERLYGGVLEGDPANIVALHSLGVLHYQNGRHDEALKMFNAMLRINPDIPEALSNQANVLRSLGRPEEALASCDRALGLRPQYAGAHNNRGVVLMDLGRLGEALASFERALLIDPRNPETQMNRGIALSRLEWFGEAVIAFDAALEIRGQHPSVLHYRGKALHFLGRLTEALRNYDEALALKPDLTEAYNDRGVTLSKLKRFDEAVAAYDAALAQKPSYAAAWNNRGTVLGEMRRFEEALQCFNKALAIEPDFADALKNRSAALQDLNRFEEALANLDILLGMTPGHAESWNNRAVLLARLRRFEEAVSAYDRALALKPVYAAAWNNRGTVMQSLRRFAEALHSFDQAIAIEPDFADALYNRSTARWSMDHDYGSAVSDLEKAVLLDGDQEFWRGELVHLRMHAADWRDFDEEVARLQQGVRAGAKIAKPFMYQAISESPADLHTCSRIYAQALHPPVASLATRRISSRPKIRVGYVSGEFREQATSYLMAGLFEAHDKAKFEIIAFDNGWADPGPTRKRLEAAFDQMVNIAPLSDRQAAEAVWNSEIDILVNLNGYFGLKRMGVFAQRPAPIQVNYLGFPGTLGAPYIDYLIADRIVIPPDQQQHYSEKIAYLPDSYQANDRLRPIAEIAPGRAAYGLPEKGFVFCNFNQSYKLTPLMFALWMRILRQVEGSVLWLFESNSALPVTLRHEAHLHGVSPSRLVFAPNVPIAEHLARLRMADLFLDSLPYNAHTTASDALWAGVPLLTCLGTTFPGRVAASLLHAIGLSELVTNNLEDYETLALKLAGDPSMHRRLRGALALNRLTTPLFDTERFTRHIETAYTTMCEISLRGETLRSFCVPAD